MYEPFDPTPYLRASGGGARRAAVASGCDQDCYPRHDQETSENSHSSAPAILETGEVAGIAGIAGPPAFELPWRAGLARFLVMPCPDDRSSTYWRRLQIDCERFDREWGRTAMLLGWSAVDAFGSPPDPSSAAVDQLGLVPLLRGRTIAAMTAQSATILNEHGAPNTFRLYPGRRPSVPLWIAYSPRAGP